MEFGKLNTLVGVDLSLPEDHHLNKEFFSSGSEDFKKVKFYIGGSVWGDNSYKGVVYPKKSKAAEYLSLYANQFNSIELNSTHYKIPSLQLVEKWKNDVSGDFVFSPKFPQIISHRFSFARRNDLANEFIASIYHFQEHLGMSFLQFPPGFSSNYLLELFSFLDFLPQDFELAIEFRHPSWFKDDILLRLRDFFLNRNSYLLMTDVAGRRDVLHQMLTGKKVFVRFVGNNLVPSDNERIDHWVNRIEQWIDLGVNQFYFYIHQPTKGWASYTIKYMINALNIRFQLELKAPLIIADLGGQQELTLF